MNLKPRPVFARLIGPTFALTVLLLSGCWKDRIVWSPDGTRAAIITDAGLYLSDADGKLSPLLVPGVYRAVWLGDSQQLVLARSRPLKDYAALAAALGSERTKALAAEAEAFRQNFNAKGPDTSWTAADADQRPIFSYLHEYHRDFVAKLAENGSTSSGPEDPMMMPPLWHSVVVARVVGDRVELGATLSEGLAGYKDIRPSPNGSAVAIVAANELSPKPDFLRVLVSPMDGSAPPALVAERTAAHPDWTPDSRTLVYFQLAGSGAASKELQLGALVERTVIDPAGRIHPEEGSRDLVGLIFQEDNRVRCLRDGRVIFNAAEIKLPVAARDRAAKEQLFALDRTQDAPELVPLVRRDQHIPDALTGFEVSPDGGQVLFFSGNSDADVLTLATGNVEHLALGIYDASLETDKKENDLPLPVWRRPGELAYLKRTKTRNEVVLRRSTGAETILSRTWPDEILAGLTASTETP